jgi:hypothetical protein
MTKDYEVSLSFASEQRSYVLDVARHLKAARLRVFYDEYERVNLWGKDLAEYLQQLYLNKSEYVVIFISQAYVEKIWTGHEKKAALAAALTAGREYILPVRFDDTELPGLNPTVRHENANRVSSAELAGLIVQKLGRKPGSTKGSLVAPPAMPDTKGVVQFDHHSHNGRFVIGRGLYEFETAWSPGPWIYNDPDSIWGVAISDVNGISDITNATTADFTSRTRGVRVNDVVILRNVHDRYAALKVLEIREQRPGPFIKFEYVIMPDGETDFSGGLATATP